MHKKHRNELFKLVRDSGLDPRIFEVDQGGMTFFLSIPTEGLAFKVWNASGNDERYQVEFKPRFRLDKYVFTRTGLVIGDFLKNSGFFSGGDSYVSFNTVRARMLLWLNDLVIPNVGSSAEADLWSQYRKERGKLRRPSPAGWNTSKFSKSEREQIQRSIGTFRLAIIDNFDPSEEQLQRIEDQLDYLTKSLYTLNKFDWQSVALSTIIGIITTLSLDTARGEQLWRYAEQAFGTVVKFLHGG